MNASWKNRLTVVFLVALLVVVVVLMARSPSSGADPAPTSGPRYTVIDTEAHNLIVTDNQSNTLYFYTIDKDKEVGADLKLRGSLDLNQVGKPVIKPTAAKQ